MRQTALDEIHRLIDGLQLRFEERSSVVETGRVSAPSTVTSPLTVLEPESTKPLPPPAFNLKKGDALAVSGRNFIVDAVIDIAGDQPMRLFRIDVGPERWLITNERFVADTRVGQIAAQGTSAEINGDTLPSHGGGTGVALVDGIAGQSGRQQVTYQVFGGGSAGGAFALLLTWSNASLSLVGEGLSSDEIELYGSPA
jgi:hypothetical protein